LCETPGNAVHAADVWTLSEIGGTPREILGNGFSGLPAGEAVAVRSWV
jgi:hypothetical protein